MLPYGLNQSVEFKKNMGPLLGNLELEKILNIEEASFIEKLSPVYELIKLVRNLQREKISQWDRDNFNYQCKQMFKVFA